MARKSKAEKWLTSKGLELIAGWARQGLSDEQIAGNMGIDARTLYRWKKKYGQFCRCLEENKDIADIQVENALFKRAIGYDYDEVTYTRNDDGDMVETKRVTKEVVPDVTAQKYWLTVRSHRWREGAQDANNAILESLIGLLSNDSNRNTEEVKEEGTE